jgi:hypothetical protein
VSRQASERWTKNAGSGSFAVLVVRSVAFAIDVVLLLAVGWLAAVSLHVLGMVEDDFFAHILDTMGDKTGTVSQLLHYLYDDVSETAAALTLISPLVVVIFCFLLNANHGQTFGMLATGLAHTKDSKTPMGLFGTVQREAVGLVMAPLAPAALFFNGRTVADMVCGSSVVPARTLNFKGRVFVKGADESSVGRARISRKDLAAEVSSPLGERSWNDVFFAVMYAASAVGLFFAQREFMNNPVARGIQEAASWGIIANVRSMFCNVDTFVLAHPASAICMAALGFAVFAVVMIMFRIFALPLLQLSIAAWFGFWLMRTKENLEAGDDTQIVVNALVLLISVWYTYTAYNKMKLTIAVWREAIIAVLAHPALGFSVPVIELAWQMYQVWLLSFQVTLWTVAFGAQFYDHKYRDYCNALLAWASWQQYLTVFTLRNVFEVAIAGTVAKYFFRAEDGSEDGFAAGVERTVKSFATAFTKSFGSSVLGGICMFVAGMLTRVRDNVAKIEGSTPWILFPIKLILILAKSALTVLVAWLDSAIKYSLSYVGLYGCSFNQGWRKCIGLFRADYLLADMAANGTSNGMMTLLMMFGTIRLCYVLAPHAMNFCQKTVDTSVGEEKNRSAAWFIAAYVSLSMFWTFFGAVRAILICTFEDLKYGRGSISRLPVSPMYKAILTKYLKEDLGVNTKKL